MKLSTRWIQILSVACFAFLPACSGIGIVVDGGYGVFEITGDAGLEPSSGPGAGTVVTADVENNLGLDDSMDTPYGRVELAAGIASFTFSAFQVDQTGQGLLTQQFGDITIGTNVDTEIDLTSIKGAVHFDLINIGPVRVAPGIGVNYITLDMSVTPTIAPANREQFDAVAPVPMLFAQAEVDLGIFDAVLDVGGMQADVEDANGTFLDIELVARLRPAEHIEIFAGYRHILIDVEGVADNQDYVSDLTLSGFVIGGGISF